MPHAEARPPCWRPTLRVHSAGFIALGWLSLACGSSSNSQGTGGVQGGTGGGGASGTQGGTGGGAAGGNQGGGAGGASGGASGQGGSTGGCSTLTGFTEGDHNILNVTWPAGVATMGGTGQVHVWTKVVYTVNGNALNGMAQACGTVLPPTGLTAIGGGGMIQIDIPNDSWDAPSMPKFPVQATQSGWDVGSTVTYSSPSSALIGFTTDPGATWPTSYTGIMNFVDAEGDANPGLTANPRTGGGFVAPPTSILQTSRVDKVYIVIRNVQSSTLTRTACNALSGPVTYTHFDNHVIGCHVMGGQACAAADINFVDQNRTIYQVTSATSQSKVLPDNSTCADIRAALPM